MGEGIEFNRTDMLAQLNHNCSLSEKILAIHDATRNCCEFIHRISVAIYDPALDLLKTLAHSTDDGNPLPGYQVKLADTPSLHQIFLSGRPRIINDLSVFSDSEQTHSKRIVDHGFRASYTIPMYANEQLTGFIFFNSRQPNVLQESTLANLDMIARMISLLVDLELNTVQTMHGALRTATSFSSYRDPETGAHLERMSHFSRLIANEIASDQGLNDEFTESILWAAPMHDIGKIAIPDHILLKAGKLTQDEFKLMQTHTTKGRQIIDTMLKNFNLGNSSLAPVMANIAESHHENCDGTGYPCGLKGEDIPLEARIIAAADVFDALTSKRCYKPAWSNAAAYDELNALSKWKLDRRCVEILLDNPQAISDIQMRYKDEA
ncbi:MAG: HD domain-containing protein [Gammaproteobacteria bacterium]|nr:HD domain-containing protein [Gammaproteobacteria bacterium]MBU1625702.1 HD domain-containing protein [Gammaproteobacteria bacterium]MBU1980962.1 HD domain-containing protein [Gammaproteobacteria bacterium]